MHYPSTVIIRHRKENLRKCSLRGLEARSDMQFVRYPEGEMPPLGGYVLLTLEGPPLTPEDRERGLVLVDGTWRYAQVMIEQWRGRLPVECRCLPPGVVTAYPRVQTHCSDPHRGLASVEALYMAYRILGRPVEGLLDGYYWQEQFLQENSALC
jgi:pre-rRNA-processing protein TSR3